MSLLLWLPLNNEINNQGLLALPSFSFNGFIREEGGKIGKYCYIDRAVTHFSEDFLDNKWTIACWVKSTGWSAYNDIILCKNENSSDLCQFYLSIINGTSFNLGINGGSNNGAGGFNYTFSTNTWYHLAATYDGTKYAMYINGNKVKSGTCTTAKPDGLLNLGFGCRSANSDGTSTTGNNQKRLNDIRIYDHVLSMGEIKELSKGLIIHYPLDRGNFGCENLIKGTKLLDRDVSVASGVTKKVNDYLGFTSATYDNSSGTSYHELILWSNKITVNANEVYTCTFYAKSPTSTTLTCYFYNNTSGIVQVSSSVASTGAHNTGSDGNITLQLTPKWTKYWITWTFNSVTTSATKTLLFRCLAGKSELSVCGVKLEKGNKSTLWCPYSSEDLGITFGLNDNIVHDTSGYNNNGTIVGELTHSSDTALYNCSTYFLDYTKYIQTTLDEFIPTEVTLSCWIKSSNATPRGDYHLPLNIHSTNYEISINKNGKPRMGYVVGGTRYVTDIDINVLDGEWHMLTSTYNGSVICRYVDGVLLHSVNVSGALTSLNILGIGQFPPNGITYGNTDLYESDVRVYVTALSQDDIIKLYNVKASANRNNTFFSYSYNELNQEREIEYLYDLTKSDVGSFFQDKDGLHLNQRVWVNHTYIPIDSSGKTYKYDIVYSCDAGNQFYIGWERYDANKTARSNNACIYVVNTKPSSDIKYVRTQGTVNLSTDGTNPCAFIKLRILNKWTNSTSDTTGTAIIHSLSLKEYSSSDVLTPLKINRQGIVNTTELLEKDIGVSINDTYELSSNIFYEI